ncbi:SMI1/KNR4 family protein [Hymenobacter cellulosivorans]|uniref:SMI1/KNR4 family protein n=1 Tax=Hymenobacter cellulosivorans TaxID=2932249 RepID=A0ABY4F8M6_9BACT|nr:SMI1/KNR4 family protein [Hymenobacter cellulosivorans]UOQ52875.1 SMI1/KNR4 family protein [Hymenobacter cellulosivorans]
MLHQISREILADPAFSSGSLADRLTAEQRQSQWLGAPGATEAELDAMEERLHITLPPSYRAFLQASNGFGPLNRFIWRLKPCAEVDWLVKTEAELVEMWEVDVETVPSVPDEEYFIYGKKQNSVQVRGEYFRGLLLVSDWGDAGFLALNPDVHHQGEWEAWHFANWIPGAVRYRSFAELVQAHLAAYQAIKNGARQ